MRYAAFATVSAIALALGACGKKADTEPQASPAADAVAPATDPAMPASPAANAGQTFADTAAASDMFEIESSKLAQAQASAAKVKSFAQTMIKQHTESTAKLKTAAAAATPPITPAPRLSPAQQQTLDGLKAKSGAEFDKAYAAAQVDAHQQTLDALKSYSASGDVASLKSFATETIPVVTAHLNMAKGL
jgi:putative membrane protein